MNFSATNFSATTRRRFWGQTANWGGTTAVSGLALSAYMRVNRSAQLKFPRRSFLKRLPAVHVINGIKFMAFAKVNQEVDKRFDADASKAVAKATGIGLVSFPFTSGVYRYLWQSFEGQLGNSASQAAKPSLITQIKRLLVPYASTAHMVREILAIGSGSTISTVIIAHNRRQGKSNDPITLTGISFGSGLAGATVSQPLHFATQLADRYKLGTIDALLMLRDFSFRQYYKGFPERGFTIALLSGLIGLGNAQIANMKSNA